MEKISNLQKFYNNLDTTSTLIFKEFKKKLFDNSFFLNLEYLIEESELVEFDKESWKRRPELFCNDYYGNPNYYLIVLLVNNLDSRFHFHPNNIIDNYIYASTQDSVKKILKISKT